MKNCYKHNFNSINENKSEKEPIFNQNKTQNENSRFNRTRTNLLIVANEELNKLKKNCLTRINDKTLATAEKEFTSQNNQIVSLKSEFYHPFTNNCQSFFTKQPNKFFYNSPDDSTRIDKNRSDDNYSPGMDKREFFSSNTKVSDMDVSYSPSPKKFVEKKKSIFKKKDEYFKSVTLKIFKEEEEEFESNEKTYSKENKNLQNLKNYQLKSKYFSNKNSERQNQLYENLNSDQPENLNHSRNLKSFLKILFHNTEPNINKKQKKQLANSGFKYLYNLCKKIKLKHKRKVFYSSGEKESLIKQKNTLEKTDKEKFEVESSNSNYQIQIKSSTNLSEKLSIHKNKIPIDIKKTKSSSKISVPDTKSSKKNKIPKYYMRENIQGRSNHKIGDDNVNTDIGNINGIIQSELKDSGIRPRKQAISGLSKSNNRDNCNMNHNSQNQNLNHSYDHDHKKEEFFIKLHKC